MTTMLIANQKHGPDKKHYTLLFRAVFSKRGNFFFLPDAGPLVGQSESASGNQLFTSPLLIPVSRLLSSRFFHGRQVIYKQNTLNMVIFVLDNTGYNAIKVFGVLIPLRVEVVHLDPGRAQYLSSHPRNTQTTFLKAPLFTGFFQNSWVYKGFFTPCGFSSFSSIGLLSITNSRMDCPI